MAEHTTAAGDIWDGLALRLLGDERHFHLLLLANPAYAYLIRLPAGLVLSVPAAPTEAVGSSLPPWRRP